MGRFLSLGSKATAAYSTIANRKSLIFPPKPGKQIVLRSLAFASEAVDDTIYLFNAKARLQTTVYAATADAAVSLLLNGDSNGYINGYQIANDDFILVQTANDATQVNDDRVVGHEWRLLHASACTESGAVATATVAGLDGHTGIEGAIAAGALAYVIPAASLRTLEIKRTLPDAVTVTPVTLLEVPAGWGQYTDAVFCAEDSGLPMGVMFGSKGTNGFEVIATAEYVADTDTVRFVS